MAARRALKSSKPPPFHKAPPATRPQPYRRTPVERAAHHATHQCPKNAAKPEQKVRHERIRDRKQSADADSSQNTQPIKLSRRACKRGQEARQLTNKDSALYPKKPSPSSAQACRRASSVAIVLPPWRARARSRQSAKSSSVDPQRSSAGKTTERSSSSTWKFSCRMSPSNFSAIAVRLCAVTLGNMCVSSWTMITGK